MSFLVHCCEIIKSVPDLARVNVGWPPVAGEIWYGKYTDIIDEESWLAFCTVNQIQENLTY